MSLYARHKVQYLCLAWIDGIFATFLTVLCFCSHVISAGEPGILHPAMLFALVCVCFLQSIYPLSIPMPGYLQWGRMWHYAIPAIVWMILYIIVVLFARGEIIKYYTIDDIIDDFLNIAMILRLAALVLGIYYIANIFRLPKAMAKHAHVPRYLIGYCSVLGAVAVLYVMLTIFYSITLLVVYTILFTAINLYLVLRTLETMAINLPKPVIETVREAPTEEQIEQAEQEDFNDANLQRFQRIQYWMQHNREIWTDNTFNRERLCEAVGYNRHIVLQTLRSQGFNNVHDYINSYRIDLLKQLLRNGTVKSVSEALMVGFGTTKTVRSCYEKLEGVSLDEVLKESVSSN